MRTHSKVKGYCTERSAHLGTAWGLINSFIQLRKRTQYVCVLLCMVVGGGISALLIQVRLDAR